MYILQTICALCKGTFGSGTRRTHAEFLRYWSEDYYPRAAYPCVMERLLKIDTAVRVYLAFPILGGGGGEGGAPWDPPHTLHL